MSKSRLPFALALLPMVVSAALAAQNAATENAKALDEVKVTARKVEESIRKIPLTISAYTAERIEQRGFDSIDDIAAFEPGLHISRTSSIREDTSLRFRGMDSGTNVPHLQNSSAFLDGILIPGSTQFLGLDDIERVEIVKGPQSAFFGRSTFGGAVNFITRTPGPEAKGRIGLTVGRFGRVDSSFSYESPLVENKAAARVSLRRYEFDGAYRNAAPSAGRLGGQSSINGAFTLFLTPSDTFDAKFRIAQSSDDDGAPVGFVLDGTFRNCGPFSQDGLTGTRTYFCGVIAPPSAAQVGYNTDMQGIGIRDEFGFDRNATQLGLTMHWDLNGYDLASVSGSHKESNDSLNDFSLTLPGTFLSYSTLDYSIASQEFRITSPQEQRLRWLAGLFYLRARYASTSAFGCANPGGTPPFCSVAIRARGLFPAPTPSLKKVENEALFAAVNFDLLPTLTVSLEARYARDFVDEGVARPSATETLILANTYESTTPRLIVDFKPNDDWMIYAQYAEGTKPGAFNPDIARRPAAVRQSILSVFGIGIELEEETLKNVEVGTKGLLLDGRLQLNAALYRSNWRNQQFRQSLRGIDSNGDGVVDNRDTQIDVFSQAGRSTIKGFELELFAQLAANVRAELGYNLNRTRYVEFLDANYAQVFGSRDAAGKYQPRSPVHSGNVAIDTEFAAFGDFRGYARGEFIYTGSSYEWAHNLAETGIARTVNARIGVKRENLTIGLYVTNAFDDDTLTGLRRTTDLYRANADALFAGLAEPREYGLTLVWTF
jgi:iron complex outermembrane recepter protein